MVAMLFIDLGKPYCEVCCFIAERVKNRGSRCQEMVITFPPKVIVMRSNRCI